MHRPRLLLVATLLVTLPVTAQAQLGGLLNRAKQKAEEKITGRAAPDRTPRFDESTVELTDDQLARMTTALAAAETAMQAADRDVGARHARYEQAVARYEAANGREDAARAAYQRQVDAYNECMGRAGSMVPQAGPTADQMAFAQRMEGMSDEERDAFEKKMERITKKMQAAHDRGDEKTARLMADSLHQLTGVDAYTPDQARAQQARTAQARKAAAQANSCGPVPQMNHSAMTGPRPERPELPPEVRAVSHHSPYTSDARDDSVTWARYRAERVLGAGDSAAVEATRGKMTAKQFAIARERIAAFYAGKIGPRSLYVFSDAEMDALEKHRNELRPHITRLDRGIVWY